MAPKVSHLFSYLFLYPLIILLISQANADHTNSSSPFDFLKHLQRCHKGDKPQGLHKLKQYLRKFGYLNSHPYYSQNQTWSIDDNFDDLLEKAIKTYQLNYHLKPTGTLDPQTASKMMTPRCGVPNIVNGTTSMRSDKKRHNSLHTVSHYSFVGDNVKWPIGKPHLTYGFWPNTNPTVFAPVASAFEKWASASSHFTFEQVDDFINADINISFDRGSHGDGNAFDGPGGVLAHASPPQDGSLHFDADKLWSVGGPVANAIDLESVALHEIGHLLGLGHSSIEYAIMYPTINPGAVRGLHMDDIQGIMALYNVRG